MKRLRCCEGIENVLVPQWFPVSHPSVVLASRATASRATGIPATMCWRRGRKGSAGAAASVTAAISPRVARSGTMRARARSLSSSLKFWLLRHRRPTAGHRRLRHDGDGRDRYRQRMNASRVPDARGFPYRRQANGPKPPPMPSQRMRQWAVSPFAEIGAALRTSCRSARRRCRRSG